MIYLPVDTKRQIRLEGFFPAAERILAASVLLILGTLVNLAILNSDIVKRGLSILLSLVVNPPIPLCYRYKKSRQNLLFRNGL